MLCQAVTVVVVLWVPLAQVADPGYLRPDRDWWQGGLEMFAAGSSLADRGAHKVADHHGKLTLGSVLELWLGYGRGFSSRRDSVWRVGR